MMFIICVISFIIKIHFMIKIFDRNIIFNIFNINFHFMIKIFDRNIIFNIFNINFNINPRGAAKDRGGPWCSSTSMILRSKDIPLPIDI